VNELHSIDFAGDKVAMFSLTLKAGGVKQTRSLTRSEFFRLVQRPGLKRDHS
jgi:hypothetical protein